MSRQINNHYETMSSMITTDMDMGREYQGARLKSFHGFVIRNKEKAS